MLIRPMYAISKEIHWVWGNMHVLQFSGVTFSQIYWGMSYFKTLDSHLAKKHNYTFNIFNKNHQL